MTNIESGMEDGIGFMWLEDDVAKDIKFKEVDEEGDGKITLAEVGYKFK